MYFKSGLSAACSPCAPCLEWGLRYHTPYHTIPYHTIPYHTISSLCTPSAQMLVLGIVCGCLPPLLTVAAVLGSTKCVPSRSPSHAWSAGRSTRSMVDMPAPIPSQRGGDPEPERRGSRARGAGIPSQSGGDPEPEGRDPEPEGRGSRARGAGIPSQKAGIGLTPRLTPRQVHLSTDAGSARSAGRWRRAAAIPIRIQPVGSARGGCRVRRLDGRALVWCACRAVVL